MTIALSRQNESKLYFVHVQSPVDYPTAAVTRKTPTLALCCLHIGLCRTVPPVNRTRQRLPPPLYDDLTMLSCPPFLLPPAHQPIIKKLGRGRAGSTASGRRSGTRAANGRPCCPGRAQVLGRTRGSAWRRK